jgi:hypothetical protein
MNLQPALLHANHVRQRLYSKSPCKGLEHREGVGKLLKVYALHRMMELSRGRWEIHLVP